MEMNRVLSGIYLLCKFITRFAYLNILWVLFSLLGAIVLGIIPSTVAMFAVARKTAMGEDDIPVFKTFWSTYQAEFLRSNGLGLIITGIGFLWYFDLQFFRQLDNSFGTVMSYLLMLIGLIYVILLLYIFPVFVHFELKLLQYITLALKIGFLRPATIILMLVGSLGTYYFVIYFPGLIPLFGISFFVYFNMWVAFKSFEAIGDVSSRNLINNP